MNSFIRHGAGRLEAGVCSDGRGEEEEDGEEQNAGGYREGCHDSRFALFRSTTYNGDKAWDKRKTSVSGNMRDKKDMQKVGQKRKFPEGARQCHHKALGLC